MEKLSYRITKYIPLKKIRNLLRNIINFIEEPYVSKNYSEIKEDVNKLVWYIPFKQLRNDIRYLILFILKKYDNDYYLYYKFDILNRYRILINNLDNDSINLVNKIIYNALNNKTYSNQEDYDILKEIETNHNSKISKIGNNRYMYDNKYILINVEQQQLEITNFYDKMFIDSLKNPDYFKNKAIIDAGAWIGDTALVLSEYTNNKVYAFEPIAENINTMKEIIEINKKHNIVPVRLALGDDNKKMEASISGSYSYFNDSMFSSNNKTEFDMVTLDKFVEDNNIEVGLIKTDLEGFEQPFLRGAINTIKKQKPTLIISIYHSYEDFFEIKPMIESWNLGYKFSIKKGNEFHTMIGTLLIAEI